MFEIKPKVSPRLNFFYLNKVLGIMLREGSLLKNVTKSGQSPKGGEGSALRIKKSTIQNVDFLIRGRGDARFSGFSQM